jgi:hypothetical protein
MSDRDRDLDKICVLILRLFDKFSCNRAEVMMILCHVVRDVIETIDCANCRRAEVDHFCEELRALVKIYASPGAETHVH